MNPIKQLRTEAKMSQERLAAQLNVSRSTIAMWETGGSNPDKEMLAKMSKLFGVTVDYLLGLDTEKGPLTVTDEEALDQELISLLTSLTPAEQEKAAAFVQGLIANREA